MAACVHIFGVIFYGFFASGEKQVWAEPHEDMIKLCEQYDDFDGEVADTNKNTNYGTLGGNDAEVIASLMIADWKFILQFKMDAVQPDVTFD